jgi:fructokinase
MSTLPLLAAVEGGGTSFVLTIAELQPSTNDTTTEIETMIPHTQFKIIHKTAIKTTTPEETLSKSAEFFSTHRPEEGYDSLGICTFGPVGVNPSKPDSYGKILPGSPKKDWRNVDILSPILVACSGINTNKKPTYKVDTDVNAPAMAEFEYRTKILKENISSLAYVTVGTGIGVGLVINSLPVHGMMHPEGGHVPIVPLESTDNFTGYSWGAKCPYKGVNTVEGTASSVALTERLGTSSSSDERDSLKELNDEHRLWDHASNAIANLCVTLTLITSVEKIVLGGGVMNRTIIYDKIRSKTKELLNGYLDLEQVTTDDGLRDYIGPSVWKESEGHGAGLVGSLVLAKSAYDAQK